MGEKLSFLSLVLIITCLAACSTNKTQDPVISPESLTPTTINSPASGNTIVEYGKPELITDNTGPLRVHIAFPVAGDATDEAMAEWARVMYQTARDEMTDLRRSDPDAEGEVIIQFDSYFVDDRYAGIIEDGMFMSSHMAHPASIVRTFNIDTKSKTMLANTDILDYSQLERILAVMRDRIIKGHPDAADHLGETDKNWLEHLAIGHDGIIVVLERGAFLPSYLGAVKVTLPYDKLGPAFLPGTPAPKPPI